MKEILKISIIGLVFIFFSCDNEPVDFTKINAEDAIKVNSDLYNNIERITDEDPNNNLVCIDFLYSFTLNIFNEELVFVENQLINNDLEFSSFLENLQEEYSISISYPIISTNDDGQTIEITNNDELKDVIDSCIEDEIIINGTGLLTQQQCIWRVLPNENGNNDFEDVFFDVSFSGLTTFNHESEVYFGTWVLFIIGNQELHLNINIDGNTTINENWNIDWIVTILDGNNMKLENNDNVFFIRKECGDITECNQLIFEECEINTDEGIAEFILEDYIECLPIEIEEETVITFYENFENLENNINPITATPYVNTINPQFVYIKIENNGIITNQIIIQLVAVNCE